MEKTRENIAGALFAQHPQEKGFYFTSDHQAFTESHKADAKIHANSLVDKTVDWIAKPGINTSESANLGEEDLEKEPDKVPEKEPKKAP